MNYKKISLIGITGSITKLYKSKFISIVYIDHAAVPIDEKFIFLHIYFGLTVSYY